MKQNYLLRLYLLFALAFAFTQSHATITVDSVHVTPSTCPNNGTTKIYARSTNNNAVFLFNIVSGPVTYTQQNDSTFYSLYPGNYTGWVHDVNSFDSTLFAFVVTGHYINPVITASNYYPLCDTGAVGQIVGHLTPNTGLSPYKWQIYSPDSSAYQASDTFSALNAGNYIIRVTDACGIARLAYTDLDSGSTGLTINDYSVIVLNCDSEQLFLDFRIDSTKGNLPIKVSVTLSSGVSVYYAVPHFANTSDPLTNFEAAVIVHGIQYGKPCKICVTDTCNHSTCIFPDSVIPFSYRIAFVGACGATPDGIITRITSLGSSYQFAPSISYLWHTFVIKNASTLAVVDSFQFSDSCRTCNVIPAPVDSGNYLVTISDTCGNFFQQTIHWPGNIQPSVQTYEASDNECLDSVCEVMFYNFQGFNNPCQITLLSGPASVHSTRNGYAYRDTLIYPMQFYGDPINNSKIASLAPGNYTYKVSDSCHNVYGSFTLSNPTQIHNDALQLVNNCNGSSQVVITSYAANSSAYLVDLVSGFGYSFNNTGSEYVSPPITPSTYVVREFFTYLGGQTPLGITCWSDVDTINVPNYNDSTFRTIAVAACNGIIHVSVIADSANGIPPFRYSIESGPQTFAFQNSADFVADSFGTYLISVMDSCGNIDARYVTIDTGRFDPVERTGGNCEGSQIKLYDVSSPYFTYVWYMPGGNVYIGDTLIINSLTDADTGTYVIKKIININGCRDSVFGRYNLTLLDTFTQNVVICPGDVYHQNSYTYNAPGTYYDLLTNQYGCDSVVVTNLTVSSPLAAINVSDTSTCRTGAVTLTATGGGTYTWSNAQSTAAITVNPQTLTSYTVVVTDSNNCSASAQATVYPDADSSINVSPPAAGICPGDSTMLCGPAGFATYHWNNNDSTQCITIGKAGSFSLSVTDNNGCSATSGAVPVHEYATVQPVIGLHAGSLASATTYAAYQWYLNGNLIPGATGQSIGQLSSGSYTLQVTDTNGCINTSQPYVITGISTTGNTPYLSVSPNPNNTNIWHVNVSAELANAQCQVFDVDGKAVYTTHLTGTSNNVTTHLAAGAYIMRVSTGQSVYNIKLVQF